MIDPQQPVRVYRNWKHDCYSIMQDGLLRASAREVVLSDVRFVVRESGRQRMLARRTKTVHAYAVGTLVDFVHPDDGRALGNVHGRVVFYDGWRFPHFVDAQSLDPVFAADRVHLSAEVTYIEASHPPSMAA